MLNILAIIFVSFLSLINILESQAAPAPGRINIVDPGAVGSVSVLLTIAKEQGLFAKQSIEARVIFSRGGPRLTAILKGGDIQFGYIGVPAALRDISQGADLKILGSFNLGRVSNQLVASPDIKKLKTYAGRDLAYSALGQGYGLIPSSLWNTWD